MLYSVWTPLAPPRSAFLLQSLLPSPFIPQNAHHACTLHVLTCGFNLRAGLTTLTHNNHQILLELKTHNSWSLFFLMATEALLKQCYNKGCGKKYSEEEDTDGDPYQIIIIIHIPLNYTNFMTPFICLLQMCVSIILEYQCFMMQ